MLRIVGRKVNICSINTNKNRIGNRIIKNVGVAVKEGMNKNNLKKKYYNKKEEKKT